MNEQNKIYHPFYDNSDIDKSYVYGSKAFETYRLIRKQKRGEVIKDLKSFSGKISNILNNGDYLMIKGSNATGLHKVSKDFIGRHN